MNLAKEKWTNLKQDFCHFHPLHQQTLEFAPGRSGFVEVHSSPSPQVATSLATKSSREKKKYRVNTVICQEITICLDFFQKLKSKK